MAAGPTSKLAEYAKRTLPTHHSTTTVTSGGASSVTFTATDLGKVFMVVASAKTHINTATATTSHVWLTADVPQEFEPTAGKPTLYLIAASATATVAIGSTGND